MHILAGIVTYNPDIDRLEKNITAIYKQVDSVYIVDNGSEKLLKLKNTFPNLKITFLKNNMGIAYALRLIMKVAAQKNYDWVLTLDQDSISYPNLINNYKKYIDYKPNIGALTCIIKDRNFSKVGKFKSSGPLIIDNCITSGCFMNVKAYSSTNGYDKKMFIDKVDFDICESLKENGFYIMRIPCVGLLHEVGHASEKKCFGKILIVYNHSPLRKYYISRNAIYFARKHKDISLKKEIFGVLKEIAIITMFENCKMKKIEKCLKGTIDGFRQRID